MRRVVVIGGSTTGLLIARVMSEFADSVVLLDRDVPPAGPENRRGVGQGFHAHSILDSGKRAIEGLFPGLFQSMLDDGGVDVDFGTGATFFQCGNYKVRQPMGLSVAVQSRALLEYHIRRRVERLPNVEARYGPQAYCKGLDIWGGRVRGVRLGMKGYPEERLSADAVIVATGHGKQPIRWLAEHQLPEPPTVSIPISIGYSSRLYRGTPDITAETPIMVCYGTRERTKRHAIALRVETGDALITCMGYDRDYPPRDPDEWEAWTRTLEAPDIARNVEAGEAVSEVVSYRVPFQIRRDWHKLPLPDGMLVLGDAACVLDPVFGQGISVTAGQVMGIQEAIRRKGRVTNDVQRIAARSCRLAWVINCIEIARYPNLYPHVPVYGTKLLAPFLDKVYAVSSWDPEVYREFLQIMVLNKSPLMHPRNLLRIFRDGRSPVPDAVS